jgi:hypothetical protein
VSRQVGKRHTCWEKAHGLLQAHPLISVVASSVWIERGSAREELVWLVGLLTFEWTPADYTAPELRSTTYRSRQAHML